MTSSELGEFSLYKGDTPKVDNTAIMDDDESPVQQQRSNALRFLYTIESLDMLRQRVRTKLSTIQIGDFLPFVFNCNNAANSSIVNYLTHKHQNDHNTSVWTRILITSPSAVLSKFNLIHQAIQLSLQHSISVPLNRQSGSSTTPIDIPKQGKGHRSSCSHNSLADFQTCRLTRLHPIFRYFPDPQELQVSLDVYHLTAFCVRNKIGVFVWEYKEECDALELAFIHNTLSDQILPPLHTLQGGYNTLIDWIQGQMDNNAVMSFIIYDQAKRIDRILFKSTSLDRENRPPMVSIQQMNSLSLRNAKFTLKQKYKLEFSSADITPFLFATHHHPVEKYSIYTASPVNKIPIQLFCRRLSDYMVAPLGLVDVHTNQWSYNTDFYGHTLWNGIMDECNESNSIVFHFIIPKAETARFEAYHDNQASHITVIAMTDMPNNQARHIELIKYLPLKHLPTLLTHPQFKILTVAVQRATLMTLTDFYVTISSSHREGCHCQTSSNREDDNDDNDDDIM